MSGGVRRGAVLASVLTIVAGLAFLPVAASAAACSRMAIEEECALIHPSCSPASELHRRPGTELCCWTAVNIAEVGAPLPSAEGATASEAAPCALPRDARLERSLPTLVPAAVPFSSSLLSAYCVYRI